LAVLPELHVSYSELLGTTFGSGVGVGVFAHSEEVVEGCVGEVADCLGFGRGGSDAFPGTPTWDRYWDGELGLWDRVRAPIAFDLLF